MNDTLRAVFALFVLFLINTMNFYDRQILGVVTEPLRKEWGLSDSRMALLGTAFTLIYAAVGVPLGRLTDKVTRTRILAAGVFVWSILTATSGLARNYWQLFAMRLGVGVGEASCAPAAASLIGDYFKPKWRATALSIFMLGLPIGLALSYWISGRVAYSYGWRAAFYIAIVPGLLIAVLALLVKEPARGATELHQVGGQKRSGSPYLLVLSIPTMWWIILSGALHNFNMYAIGSFLTPYLMRFHGISIRDAGTASMVVGGLAGIPGLLLGGLVGDAIKRHRADGRMIIGTLALAVSVPLVFLALRRPAGDVLGFAIFMGLGYAVMNAYYSTVYSTIQDIIEPSLRGTAMALYFFAMYVLGASLGPYGTGLASDYFTHSAARAAGVTDTSLQALEPFKAEGLHTAMYVIPLLGILLTLVLLAGSRTVTKDMEKLQRWMRESAEKSGVAEAAKVEAAK